MKKLEEPRTTCAMTITDPTIYDAEWPHNDCTSKSQINFKEIIWAYKIEYSILPMKVGMNVNQGMGNFLLNA